MQMLWCLDIWYCAYIVLHRISLNAQQSSPRINKIFSAGIIVAFGAGSNTCFGATLCWQPNRFFFAWTYNNSAYYCNIC